MKLIVLLGLVSFIIWYIRNLYFKVTVFEYEHGLLFERGQFQKVLSAGQYTYLKKKYEVNKFDNRSQMMQVSGQEILCKDKITIKMSLMIEYSIVKPEKTRLVAQDYVQHMYSYAQLVLRDIVQTYEMEQAIESSKEIATLLEEKLKDKFDSMGISLSQVHIRDIMLSNDLRRSFTEVVKAQKEAQAALEKARGETATLRHLANAAKLLEKKPSLLQLRLIQSVEAGQGHTIIFNQSPSSDSLSTENIISKEGS